MKIRKVLDQDRFEKIKAGYEGHWFSEEVNAAKFSLLFKFKVELREHLRGVKFPAATCDDHFS